MSRILQICLIILVALTVGHSQVFGVQRGFICKDGAKPQETNATHCHRTGNQAAAHKNGHDTGHHASQEAAQQANTEEAALAPLALFAFCDFLIPSPECPSGEASQHTSQKVDFEPAKLADASAVTAPHFIPVATLDDLATFKHLLGLFTSQPSNEPLPQYQEEAREHGATSVLVAESVILLV